MASAKDKTAECDEIDLKEKFQTLKAQLSKHYDGRYFKWLRFCLHGYIPLGDLDRDDVTAMSLFNELQRTGKITPHKVSLLLDVAKVTGFSEAVGQINQYMADNNVQLFDEETLSTSRKELFQILRGVGQDELKNIVHNYDELNKFEFTNIWDAIFVLEKENLLDTPSKMTRFTDCLGKSAQDRDGDKIRHYLLTNQQRLYRNCNRFTPQIMNSAFEVDIADMFTELVLLKAGDKPTKLQLKDVILKIESTPECRVLISGEGGIGKTTLLRYFAYNWATKKSFEIFKGKILFLVNIRDLDKDRNILDLILKEIELDDFSLETDLAEDPKLIKKFIMDHPDEIVLLLDGLDELRFQNKSPLRLFKKQRLERSLVVVTSRSINIDEYIKNSNVHVQVKGFDYENVTKYITQYFQQVEKPELGNSLIEKLRVTIVAYQMCKNPMLLLSICFMWEEEQHLPTDKADLFKAFFLCILNQFNRQDNISKIPAFEEIPEKYLTSMLLLGKCMYDGLKNNQLSFIKTDLHTIAIRDKVDDTLALELGFVYEDKTHLKKSKLAKTYTAPHKLIVESLVGFYLYKLCELVSLESESNNLLLSTLGDEEWENIRESEHLKMTHEFAIGFLGSGATMFLKHWITNRFPTYRSLILLLKWVLNKEHLEDVENELMDHVTQLDIMNSVCNSLRIFLTYQQPNVSVDTNNLFYLMRKIHDIHNPIINERFCDNMPSGEKGKVLAHSLIAVSDQSKILERIGGDCMSYVIDECEKHNMKYDISHLTIYHPTAEHILVHILTNSPQLKCFIAKPDALTGTILNDIVSQHCSKSVRSSEVIHVRKQPIFSQLNKLVISGNDLSKINGASLASLFNISNIKMHNCSLSGGVMNDMVSVCSSRRGILTLSELDISDNNLSQIDGVSMAYLMNSSDNRYSLDMHNCSLSGGVMNDMIRGCSRRGVTLTLSKLDISDNNLSQINRASFECLVNISQCSLNMHNCSLPCEVMNDMISKDVTFKVSSDTLSQIDGASISSLTNLFSNLDDIKGGYSISFKRNDITSSSSSVDVTVKVGNDIHFSQMDSTSMAASYLTNVFYNRYDLKDKYSLSAEVMKDMMNRECSTKGVSSKLSILDISDNDLSLINGSSLAYITSIIHNPHDLNMHNCNLSGELMNDMIREYSSRGVTLTLSKLDLSDNNLSKINGASLSFIFINIHNLYDLNMHNCNLSGEMMNDMIRECSVKGVTLTLANLDISDNDLSLSNGASLTCFISIIHNRHDLNMHNCNLSGEVMNDMIRECSRRGVKFGFYKLDLSDNNLSKIDSAFLAYLISSFHNHCHLNMHNCSLSGEMINATIKVCSDRGVTLTIANLDISDNNLSQIDFASLTYLIRVIHINELNMHNCNLSSEVMNDTIREGSRNVALVLLSKLDISDNNFSQIDGTSLFNICPMLRMLNMHNCNLSFEVKNAMVRECSRREVQFDH
ncbi:uncharacterized protein [Antedon mediterranea]|uniref:uncharacterized protein isoform X2 n=1 Tax=Antedon mediterranea TaxID=105859 RepID=UPI003AF572F0